MRLCTRKGPKFQYTQCIGCRPVKLKAIPRGISFEWYTIFVSHNFLSESSQPDVVHVNTCNNVQIMHPNANIQFDKTRVLSDPFQCKPGMTFF